MRLDWLSLVQSRCSFNCTDMIPLLLLILFTKTLPGALYFLSDMQLSALQGAYTVNMHVQPSEKAFMPTLDINLLKIVSVQIKTISCRKGCICSLPAGLVAVGLSCTDFPCRNEEGPPIAFELGELPVAFLGDFWGGSYIEIPSFALEVLLPGGKDSRQSGKLI